MKAEATACTVVGIVVAIFASSGLSLATELGPQPREVYREFVLHNGGNRAWRVTDPKATDPGAAQFLPNPVLKFRIDDLKDAVRAEALLDRWGGHPETSRKSIRFNDNEWLVIPELQTTPKGHMPEAYYYQDNPVIPVPLEHLKEGDNTLEGTCSSLSKGPRTWGQWGLYSLILRVYYDPQKKPYATGRILTPASGQEVQDNPSITVEVTGQTEGARVDVLAGYEGYDEDGNGIFSGWHEAWFQPLRGQPAEIQHHVGTVKNPPFSLVWDTRWVPDQPARAISLIARIRNTDGVWYVTEPVADLTLSRRDVAVKLYRAADVPERFGVRTGQTKSCVIPIPEDDDLTRATEAVLHLRTWHGDDKCHSPIKLNGHILKIQGNNHHYDYEMLHIPTTALKNGDNVFEIHSDFEHHMLEVLWPGPAITVRYSKP